jgi:TonB family protein
MILLSSITKIILTSIFIALSMICFAQNQNRQITGRIVDLETSKPVANVEVKIPDLALSSTTNQLGFFQFEIPLDAKELIISRIGYEASKILIPSSDKFQVKLKKEFVALEELQINSYQPKTQDAIEDKAPESVTTENAKYVRGWKGFYDDMYGLLKKDFIISALGDSVIHIRFIVNSKGDPSFFPTSTDTKVLDNLLKDSLLVFSKWNPAKQNSFLVDQFFDLPVSREGDRIFQFVDESAEPVGGISEIYKFIGSNIQYPALARRLGIEGQVVIQFVVEKDGSITGVKAVSKIGGGLEEEAIRLISLSPNWKPGRNKGRIVRQGIKSPINFKLH